jgi:hypothetical protein
MKTRRACLSPIASPLFLLMAFLVPIALVGCSGADDQTYFIGGTITGLTGSGLVLSMPGQADLTVAPGQTTFTFANKVKNGTDFTVSVATQPAAQTCSVDHGTGRVLGADVQVAVTCADGVWSATGALALPRAFTTMDLLPSGKVLVTGGQATISGNDTFTATAELYDPATGAWTSAASMSTSRGSGCSALLAAGKLLVLGGSDPDMAAVYDPAGNTWTSTTQQMSAARFLPACVLLDSGKLLVTGGLDAAGTASTATAELYDPATGAFTATGSMSTARYWHTATKLADGKVLVAGGCTGGWPCLSSTASAELYDPVAGTWSGAGSMPSAVVAHTATRLASGKVLVAGGCLTYHGGGACGDRDRDRRASLYDPAPGPGTWSATGSLARGHADHAALVLASGDVLLVGGGYFSGFSSLTERYDPSTGLWGPGPATLVDHANGVKAAKLPNGRWLVAGGALPTVAGQNTYTGAAEILTE